MIADLGGRLGDLTSAIRIGAQQAGHALATLKLVTDVSEENQVAALFVGVEYLLRRRRLVVEAEWA